MSMNEQFRTALVNALTEDGIDIENVRRMISAYDRISVDWTIGKASTDLIPVTNAWENALRTYVASKAVEGLSMKTLKNKAYIIRKLFEFSGRDIDTMTAQDVRGWIYSMMRNGITDRSCEVYRVTVNAFFVWCVGEGVCERNPVDKITKIRYEEKQRIALDRTEVEILRFSMKNDFEMAIVEMLLSTGCRVSELCGLMKTDVDFDNMTVHLYGKGKKHRTSYLTSRAKVALQMYLKSRNDQDPHLFITPKGHHESGMSTAFVEKLFRELQVRVSGRINKPITPHIMRHTFATLMLQSGGDMKAIQTILGHSSMDTTSIYAEVNQDTVKSEHMRFVS